MRRNGIAIGIARCYRGRMRINLSIDSMTPPPPEGDLTRTTFDIPEVLLQRLREAARERGTTSAYLLRMILRAAITEDK